MKKHRRSSMILKSIFTIGLVGSLMAVNAQSISSEVVATSGGHFQNGTSQLSWTLGEVMIDTYSAGGTIVTQGFHQTQLTVTSIDERNPFSLNVNVFPNPTSQFLNIGVEGEHTELSAKLYDMHGKLLVQESLRANQGSTQLDMSNLAMAYYILNVVDEKGKYSASYRINKIAD